MSELRSFLIIAINRKAFLITVVTWSLKVRLPDSIIPRYFREIDVLNVMSPRVICGSGYGNVRLAFHNVRLRDVYYQTPFLQAQRGSVYAFLQIKEYCVPLVMKGDSGFVVSELVTLNRS